MKPTCSATNFIACFLLLMTLVLTNQGWSQTATETAKNNLASVDEVLAGTEDAASQGTLTLNSDRQGS